MTIKAEKKIEMIWFITQSSLCSIFQKGQYHMGSFGIVFLLYNFICSWFSDLKVLCELKNNFISYPPNCI